MDLDYKVMARTMRPQSFKEIVGQDKIKQTLMNAIAMKRLGHAYLFCGHHGTGKTTLARLFAKALNCDQPILGEPCNICSSCIEITGSHSLDVIEIDGASNRGIDDIRQINETVGFATKAGKYKIYLIDEVHMLTKEAFNALLKTLEDPPTKVKFFFATTEPHKMPATILSRCQCFHLEPHTSQDIVKHILFCANKLQVSVDESSANLIAQRASGSLRDALVLTDQLITFCENEITSEKAIDFLGLMPKETFFTFDEQTSKGNIKVALELANQVYSSGKNISYFLETLSEHFRQILYIKVYKENPKYLPVSDQDWKLYERSSSLYGYEQCLHIIDLILAAQVSLKTALSKRVALENLLIQITRSHLRVSLDEVLEHLEGLKKESPPLAQDLTLKSLSNTPIKSEIKKETPPSKPLSKKNITKPLSPPKEGAKKEKSRYDTVLQFAAVELEGSLKKEGN
ncbi:MAG: Holliday junction ATP-dependent DNA helicase RuvB [Chlamydiae bacterium]|nr:Holliday junction ATP-dependent DNA helicase RuvB [Chlamydiota bacterium]